MPPYPTLRVPHMVVVKMTMMMILLTGGTDSEALRSWKMSTRSLTFVRIPLPKRRGNHQSSLPVTGLCIHLEWVGLLDLIKSGS